LNQYCTEPRANKYCNLIVQLIKKKYSKEVKSIILFGSHARGNATKISDVDLLIILYNSKLKIKNSLESEIRWLEMYSGYSKNYSNSFNLVEKMLQTIKLQTGMFRSWFITEEQSFMRQDFAKTFGVNPLLSKMLAPSSLIYFNIIREGITIYGENTLFVNSFTKNIWKFSLLRSFIMNFVEALGALFLTPFNKETSLFAVEAIKWSLFSYNFVLQSKKIQKHAPLKIKGLERFFDLRRIPRFDPILNLLTPYIVYKIHVYCAKILKHNSLR
jgi:predicted nucleotidyltransferase